MSPKNLPRRTAAFFSILLTLSGLSLGIWSCTHLPASQLVASNQATSAESTPTEAVETATDGSAQPTPQPTSTPTPAAAVIGWDEALPHSLVEIANRLAISETHVFTVPTEARPMTLRLDFTAEKGYPFYRQFFAAATQFDTIDPTISQETLQQIWHGEAEASAPYSQIVVLSDTLPSLVHLLGPAGPTVTGRGSTEAVRQAVWTEANTLALVPFDLLTPDLVVLAVDGQNPVENAAKFDHTQYPLIVTVYAHDLEDARVNQPVLAELLAESGGSNRDPNRLTVIAMTGVTAMVRQTAYQMDRFGAEWPAEVVGPELAAADITAISNEVPFVPGCATNTDPNNLVFCSKPEYMAALEASGADIIGLTGNHQNDQGRANALKSLEIYEKAGLPVYGGGKDKEAAFAPLYIEHNGNRLAFLGANSYGPAFAWAKDDAPGSAEFDLNIMSATIRNIKAKDKADVVLAELQYQESYDVQPLFDQRQNFKALTRAGADIVTGVQSHVPQAIEFEDGHLILYGLGNLYFDQMWSMATREAMIVKHTIYKGRHISTQILTTLLYDYGQPHWTTANERERILKRVFGASYWEY